MKKLGGIIFMKFKQIKNNKFMIIYEEDMFNESDSIFKNLELNGYCIGKKLKKKKLYLRNLEMTKIQKKEQWIGYRETLFKLSIEYKEIVGEKMDIDIMIFGLSLFIFLIIISFLLDEKKRVFIIIILYLTFI